MDILLCISLSVLAALLVGFIYFLKFNKSPGVADVAPVAHGAVVRPRGVQAVVVGGRGRRGAPGGARQRLAQRAAHDSDEEEDGEGGMLDNEQETEGGKVGAKKQKKLEEKAARKAQREVEQQEREEKKKQDEQAEKLRKKEEQKKEAEEALMAAEAQRVREERERQEHEEYLRLKQDFCIESEGVDAVDEQDVHSLLQEFISYIKEMKVVMLEDLAAHFKIKTQDAIDRVKTLQEDGTLSGVIDDRGKFVYITHEEYEAVARFIKQRGRVSITDLADSMNRLINLNPDTRRRHVDDPSTAVAAAARQPFAV